MGIRSSESGYSVLICFERASSVQDLTRLARTPGPQVNPREIPDDASDIPTEASEPLPDFVKDAFDVTGPLHSIWGVSVGRVPGPAA